MSDKTTSVNSAPLTGAAIQGAPVEGAGLGNPEGTLATPSKVAPTCEEWGENFIKHIIWEAIKQDLSKMLKLRWNKKLKRWELIWIDEIMAVISVDESRKPKITVWMKETSTYSTVDFLGYLVIKW